MMLYNSGVSYTPQISNFKHIKQKQLWCDKFIIVFMTRRCCLSVCYMKICQVPFTNNVMFHICMLHSVYFIETPYNAIIVLIHCYIDTPDDTIILLPHCVTLTPAIILLVDCVTLTPPLIIPSTPVCCPSVLQFATFNSRIKSIHG